MKRLLIIPLLLLSLAGCSPTLNQQIAIGYGLNTLSRNLTTAALDANKINSAEGKRMMKVQDETRSSLDTAWNIRLTYADSSKTQAAKATSSIKAIINQLENLGVK